MLSRPARSIDLPGGVERGAERSKTGLRACGRVNQTVGRDIATALSINACPYRANSVLHRRPLGCPMEAATILTRGAGDDDLLSLQRFEAIPILTPAQALQLLGLPQQ